MTEAAGTVCVVDDDEGFCGAIAWLLQRNGYDVQVHGNAEDFLTHAPRAIGCALVDLQLGTSNGIDVLLQARRSGYDAPIIIVSAFGTIPAAIRAGHGGAFEFLEKPISNDVLLDAVRRACALHADHRQQHGDSADVLARFETLTERERDVFWLLADGFTSKAVADRLGISARTAEVHRSRVLEKFQTNRLPDIIRASRQIRPFRDT